MPEHSEDFGQMGQTCDECSPCWPHRGWLRVCSCDCHPADPAADLEHAMEVIEHLEGEVERLRDLVGQHDPTGADHLAEMMEHAQRADALYDENKRLRDALEVILAGLTDALGDPMGARPSQVTTLYCIANHAMRPIQSGSSGGEG